MNIKAETIERIKDILKNEHNTCTFKLKENALKLRQLQYESTILKREKAKISQLINELDKKK